MVKFDVVHLPARQSCDASQTARAWYPTGLERVKVHVQTDPFGVHALLSVAPTTHFETSPYAVPASEMGPFGEVQRAPAFGLSHRYQ